MGCSHSKALKNRQEPKRLARAEEDERRTKKSHSRKELEAKTCRETEKKSQRRKEKKMFVWRKNEVTPLPTDPPNFAKETEKRREKKRDTATDLKDFAEEDKAAFLADRKRAKERRRQLLYEEDDDTLFEQPTRMPDRDFTQDLFTATSSA